MLVPIPNQRKRHPALRLVAEDGPMELSLGEILDSVHWLHRCALPPCFEGGGVRHQEGREGKRSSNLAEDGKHVERGAWIRCFSFSATVCVTLNACFIGASFRIRHHSGPTGAFVAENHDSLHGTCFWSVEQLDPRGSCPTPA